MHRGLDTGFRAHKTFSLRALGIRCHLKLSLRCFEGFHAGEGGCSGGPAPSPPPRAPTRPGTCFSRAESCESNKSEMTAVGRPPHLRVLLAQLQPLDGLLPVCQELAHFRQRCLAPCSAASTLAPSFATLPAGHQMSVRSPPVSQRAPSGLAFIGRALPSTSGTTGSSSVLHRQTHCLHYFCVIKLN